VHAVVDHAGARQVRELALHADPGHPDARLVHVDLVFHAARHHAGPAIDAACGVENEGFMFDIGHIKSSLPLQRSG
jgi:hypothetical protein